MPKPTTNASAANEFRSAREVGVRRGRGGVAGGAWIAAWTAVAGGLAALREFAPLWRHPGLAWAAFGLAGLGWLAAVALLVRAERCGNAPRLGIVFAGAVLLRAIVFGAEFELSDDVRRYVWEGNLVAAGHSPFVHAPAARAVQDGALVWEEQRERLPATFARLNHPEVPAAYPPATQWLAAAGVALGGWLVPARSADEAGLFGVRLLFALCDLLVVPALAWLSVRTGRSPARALVWGWSPLVALELSGSTHFDGAGVLALVVALACLAPGVRARDSALERDPARGAARRALVGGAALAIGVLVKFLPLAIVPFALRDAGAGAADAGASPVLRARALALAALVGVSALLVLPFFALDPAGFGGARGLGTYAFRWESTSLVHRFFEAALGEVFERDESATDPRRLARALAAAAWGGTAIWLYLRGAPTLRAGAILIGSFLVLSPTLHPWYLAWIVPFVALRPTPAWSWLLFAAPLLYAPAFAERNGGSWAEPAWLWPVVALPFFALALWTASRSPRP